jgi:hypothetical protein
VERFIEHSPISVMARLGLQRALDPAWIDELFEQERETQYTRELLFSTTVEIMSLVAVGLRPSVHAAAKASPALPVSITALYDKLSRTEPGLVRALVQGSARRLGPVVQPMLRKQPPSVDGYRLRIVDGSHLSASEKRLKPSEEKTRISHIAEGFDFLGQNVRKYDGKLLIKPSNKSEKALMEKEGDREEKQECHAGESYFTT